MLQRLYVIVCTIGLSCTLAATARADDADARLLDFFAGQGCAIGPTTRAAALEAGFDEAAVATFATTAAAGEGAVQTGDWLVLAPSLCTIKIPAIVSDIGLGDLEVLGHLSARDAYAEEGDPGCFLDGVGLFEEVQRTRSWDADKANLEYIRLLGRSVASGELAFYSDSPLRTPVGFALTTGDCADIPLMSEIRRNHELLIEHFDTLVRGNAPNIECTYGASPFSPELPQIASDLSQGGMTNAWIGLEIQMIAMGAGWYEGMSATQKGTPRPPLCRYE